MFHSFELSGTQNGAPVASVTNPIPIEMRVNSVPAGEQPWLYEWTADGGRPADVTGRSSAVRGRWSVVPTQSYDPVLGRVTAQLVRMGRYVLISGDLTRSYIPQVGK